MDWSSDDLRPDDIGPKSRTALEEVRAKFKEKFPKDTPIVDFIPSTVRGEGRYEITVPLNWSRSRELPKLGFDPAVAGDFASRDTHKLLIIARDLTGLPESVKTSADATAYLRDHLGDQVIKCAELRGRGMDLTTEWVRLHMDPSYTLEKARDDFNIGHKDSSKILLGRDSGVKRIVSIPEQTMHDTLDIQMGRRPDK